MSRLHAKTISGGDGNHSRAPAGGVAFTEGNKWRFSDGDATFFATIEDPDFLAAVNLGIERFAKNDMLRVRLRTKQTRDATGLHTEHAVVAVVQHIPALSS